MSTEANKNVIRRYLETWNRGDINDLAEFWSPHLVHHTRLSSHGYADTRRIVGEIMKAFPDMRFKIDDIIAEGDKVVTRMTWQGTHTGMYMGALPTGKNVTCSLIGVARLKDGKIVEHWGVTDELYMMQQMGLLPEEMLQAMA
ncbi:MAG TPA: ester cyclase [Rhodothermales bacterium]|nr:ester cyclase [Rhodothermales bacterium]